MCGGCWATTHTFPQVNRCAARAAAYAGLLVVLRRGQLKVKAGPLICPDQNFLFFYLISV
jgi:hypothetical protein